MPYKPQDIEPRWQRYWDEHRTFEARELPGRRKFYALDMFPYPSGKGLHVGHPAGYTASDVVSRYHRALGDNVLHPMGYDAFGLPAEQKAIDEGVPPQASTAEAIENFRRQLKRLGFSYDWSREISTCDPAYYKWTQWIFTQLYDKGLAYQADSFVNWCAALGTVLANDEVIDGKSERGGHPVERKRMQQWMLRITAYADTLLAGLDALDWPEETKKRQREWIGRSEGAHVEFPLVGRSETIAVFTTRPDTLWGATYMVLAPEHPLVEAITTPAQRDAVVAYQKVDGGAQRARAPDGQAEDRRRHRRARDEPGRRRNDPGVDLRLRDRRLRHRRDHGGAGARRARRGIRARDGPAGEGGHRGRRDDPLGAIRRHAHRQRRGGRQGDRVARGHQARPPHGHVQAARLDVRAAALLGRADPDPRGERRAGARARRERAAARAARGGGLPADGHRRIPVVDRAVVRARR